MENILAVRYIDALYFTEANLSFEGFKEHLALGEFSKKGGHIELVFVKENDNPVSGLLIPNEALIVSNQPELMPVSDEYVNKQAEIEWIDIVYFTESQMPVDCSRMRTEGEIIRITSDEVVIKDPVTVKISNATSHTGGDRITYVVLPVRLIKEIKIV